MGNTLSLIQRHICLIASLMPGKVECLPHPTGLLTCMMERSELLWVEAVESSLFE